MKKPSKDAISVIAGAIGGAVAGKMLIKFIPVEQPLIKALIPIGTGLMLAGQKSPMIKGVGYGMAAAGGLTLVDALMPGMLGAPNIDEEIFLGEADDELGEYEEINGPADQSVLAGPADQSVLAGDFDSMNNAEMIAASFQLEDDED